MATEVKGESAIAFSEFKPQWKYRRVVIFASLAITLVGAHVIAWDATEKVRLALVIGDLVVHAIILLMYGLSPVLQYFGFKEIVKVLADKTTITIGGGK